MPDGCAIELSGPPFPYHTVSFNDRKVTLVAPPSGHAFLSMSFGLPDNVYHVHGTHSFDDRGDVDGVASVNAMVRIYHA